MEEKVSAYLALFEAYQEELENIDKQMIYIQALINDYTRAKMTVENLDKLRKEATVLVPIGAGILVPMKAERAMKVLVSEGADVFIERSLEYAADAVQRKIDELNEGLARLNNVAQQIRQKLKEISEKIQSVREKDV